MLHGRVRVFFLLLCCERRLKENTVSLKFDISAKYCINCAFASGRFKHRPENDIFYCISSLPSLLLFLYQSITS